MPIKKKQGLSLRKQRITIKKHDTLVALMKPYLKTIRDKRNFLKLIHQHPSLATIYPKQTITLLFNKQQLKKIQLPNTHASNITIIKNKNNFALANIKQPLKSTPKLIHVTIKNSVIASARKAGLNKVTLNQFVRLFGWKIDFKRAMRQGDEFSILFKEHRLPNKKTITPSPIIAASLINQGKTYYAIADNPKAAKPNYYNSYGQNIVSKFIRYPVKFKRISSKFTTARYHPILHHIRAHKGVDYAAPTGTPIKVAGDGRILFIGNKGGYGKTIVVQHNIHISTLYGHLSRFAAKLRQGSKVKREQIIGYVGATGLATGPHLHYEFRIDGVHKNPLTIQLPKADPIAKHKRGRFIKKARQYIALLKKIKHNPKFTVSLKQLKRIEYS